MALKLHAGLRVITRLFGAARVVRADRTSALVSLDEMGGLNVEVGLDDLEPDNRDTAVARSDDFVGYKSGADAKVVLNQQTTVTAECAGTAAVARYSGRSEKLAGALPEEQGLGRARLQASVEALRFGLVPTEAIESLTLGFNPLRAWVESRCPEAHGGHPQISEIVGPYGTGKSHTMAVIRAVAQRAGYVVAHVEVDGQTISFAEPERLLCSLWSSVTAEGFESSTPLLDLCLKAIHTGQPSPHAIRFRQDRIRANYDAIRVLTRHEHALDEFGHDIEGILASSNERTASQVTWVIRRITGVGEQSVALTRMVSNRIADRPYDFVASLASYAMVAKIAGFKGLIVTIDEFEVESRFLTPQKAERVRDLLEVLAGYLQGGIESLIPAPLALFIATVGSEGHVGDAVVDAIIDTTGGHYYKLKPWPRDDRLELAQRIHTLYCGAYGISRNFEGAVVDSIENQLEVQVDDSGLIRAFIKRYVAALDSVYGPPAVS